VIDVYELHSETGDLYPAASLYLPQIRVFYSKLGELGTHEAERELRPVDGKPLELAQKVRQGAHVVLVTVGKHDAS
jgi:hypothetical protein